MRKITRIYNNGILSSEIIEEYTQEELLSLKDFEADSSEKEFNIENLEFFSFNLNDN